MYISEFSESKTYSPSMEQPYWRAPKFLGRPIWGSNYVEMRKELELGAAPNFQH
jgi:hypothetical protein